MRLQRKPLVWLAERRTKADSVWAVPCLGTRTGFRRRGLSRALARMLRQDPDGYAVCGSVDSHMTRFVVDCGVVLQLAREGIEVPSEHELLAPTLLRSQTLSALHKSVHGGEIPPDVALELLARIRVLPIRLLGDAVLRRRAWDLADQLG